jgi:biliverdin reductase
MSGSKKIHLVIVGLGAAGQARLRAAQTAVGIEVVAIVSRHRAVGNARFDEAIARDDVDAVAISTETTDHETRVRAALEAGKHVLCDYPLALSAGRASDLLKLAHRKRRVLHVEQIALLTPAHREARTRLSELGRLREGSFTFEGGWTARLADPAYAGPFPIHVESRLVQLLDLFGPGRLENVEMSASPERSHFVADVDFERGGTIRFTERRAPDLLRRRAMEAHCEKGTLTWPEVDGTTGLFALDLSFFRQRVLHAKPGYMQDSTMLRALEQIDALHGRS